ncbi:hypothetical protein [Thermoflexus sp.]|uniref:hypothetical protein n=1 Tax=Thermoflexus sp. TaxID=1969742 RepID=UPI002ADE2459|nr:hypothetical protein [Thermoflexus sp.]
MEDTGSLRRRGIRACIPENPRNRRRSRRGRPYRFDPKAYRVLRGGGGTLLCLAEGRLPALDGPS